MTIRLLLLQRIPSHVRAICENQVGVWRACWWAVEEPGDPDAVRTSHVPPVGTGRKRWTTWRRPVRHPGHRVISAPVKRSSRATTVSATGGAGPGSGPGRCCARRCPGAPGRVRSRGRARPAHRAGATAYHSVTLAHSAPFGKELQETTSRSIAAGPAGPLRSLIRSAAVSPSTPLTYCTRTSAHSSL